MSVRPSAGLWITMSKLQIFCAWPSVAYANKYIINEINKYSN